MRKILLPFAMTGLISLPLVGCDVEEETDTDTVQTDTTDTTGGDTDTTPDTGPTTVYRAIIVDDSEIFPTHRSGGGNPCASAGFNNTGDGAHGADIDTVGLFDGETDELVGYFDTVDGALGTSCDGLPNYTPNNFTDITEAKGTPNGTLSSGFVSLAGGAVTGEFDGGVELFPNDYVIVFEIGEKCCDGNDEGYHVYVAERLDCLNSANRAACQLKVTGARACANWR